MNPITTRPKHIFLLVTLLVPLLAFGLTEPILTQNPGTQHRTMQSGQQKREYLLHIPQGYQKDQPELLALVIMLHGRSSNGQRAASRYYGWTELAEREVHCCLSHCSRFTNQLEGGMARPANSGFAVPVGAG